MSEVSLNQEATLKKALGFWQIWAIGVGAVVGDGIFIYLGQGVMQGGPSAIVGVAFAGVMQMFIMIAMGELSVGMPSAGAMTLWVSKYLNRFWGLLSGMTFSVGWVICGGSTSIALGTIMAYWAPIGGQAFSVVFWAAIWWTVFTLLNIFGAAIASNVQLILVLALIAIMFLFGVFGVIHGLDAENYEPFMPFGFSGMTSTIPVAAFAFMGAACICTAGNECKNPVDLGRALVWASLTFIIVYCLAMFVVIGAVDWKVQSMDVSLFTVAAEALWGPVGGTILNLAGWLAAATCLIMGSLYTPSRIFYGMAKVGYMPKVFAAVNPKTRTPVPGLVICWAIGFIILICAWLWGATAVYTTIVNQAVLAWTISWGLAVIAGMRYRADLKSQGITDIKAHIGWKQPLYPLIPILALICSAYLFYLCLYDIWQPIALGIWFLIYVIYYLRIRAKVKAGLISDDVYF